MAKTEIKIEVRIGETVHALTYEEADALFQGLAQALTMHNKQINIGPVISIICKEFRVSKEDMESRLRTESVSRARQVAMFLIYELTQLSLHEVGKLFSRDHTSVLDARKRIEGFTKCYPETWGRKIEQMKMEMARLLPTSSTMPMGLRIKEANAIH